MGMGVGCSPLSFPGTMDEPSAFSKEFSLGGGSKRKILVEYRKPTLRPVGVSQPSALDISLRTVENGKNF